MRRRNRRAANRTGAPLASAELPKRRDKAIGFALARHVADPRKGEVIPDDRHAVGGSHVQQAPAGGHGRFAVGVEFVVPAGVGKVGPGMRHRITQRDQLLATCFDDHRQMPRRMARGIDDANA